jgi:lysophospholipase L1-like esterase
LWDKKSGGNLTGYYTKTESNTLYRDKTTTIKSVDLSQEVKDMMTGTTPVSANSKIKGKIWAAMGDSITIGAFNSPGGVPYPTVVANRTGCIVSNYGIAGTCLAKPAGQADSMSDRYTSMRADADIITVMGGANDCTFGIPNGTFTSRDPANFYGACHLLIAGLLDKYPNGTVVMFTPPQGRSGTQYTAISGYAQVIREVSAYYSVPVFDVFNMGGLTVNNATNMNNFFPDTVHPSKAGHERLGARMQSFFESLF